jgi:glycosyltransferase involved in cell wall biosynthesis
MNSPNFALYCVEDSYSTDRKIMGRQSAGKALLRGVARKWSTSEVHGFGANRTIGQAMLAQMQRDGFKGSLRWRQTPGDAKMQALGNLYYPAPPPKAVAHARNRLGTRAYSLFGVTHTVSSLLAMDLISDLILPPFQPWDGLICTSQAALTAVEKLQDQARAYWIQATGASRFNPISLKLIPLGVNVPDFKKEAGARAAARADLGLADDEVAFLLAGRLTFHAKANPAAFYQAVEAARRNTGKRLVGIEAGIYPNPSTAAAYEQARRVLAPSVRFIGVDGADPVAYQNSWAAADVFVSLSDNIQETFGITPLEAMAAGLPVVVSDWDGYKDTVRDGIDGFRIPTLMPLAGAGDDLAFRYAQDLDTYDYFIGRVSMAIAIDLSILTEKLILLASRPDLRFDMGRAGRARAAKLFDWPVILGQYAEFARELTAKRTRAVDQGPSPGWTFRPDPFALFAHYPSQHLSEDWLVKVDESRASQVEEYLNLTVAKFAFHASTLPKDSIVQLLAEASTSQTVAELLSRETGLSIAVRTRALMWLVKLGVVLVRPRA